MVEMKVSSRWFRDEETSPQNGVGLVIKCHLVKEKKEKKNSPLSGNRDGEKGRPDSGTRDGRPHLTCRLPSLLPTPTHSESTSSLLHPLYNAILRHIFCRSRAQPRCTPLSLSSVVSGVGLLRPDFR